MGILADTFLGARPDFRQIPGMSGYIDAIPGDPGGSRTTKLYRQDLNAGAEGRIEDMHSLAPTLAAIRARAASDYKTGAREMGKTFAFSTDPTLQAGMESELSARINENAGLQFADAAKDAYRTAADVVESRNRFRTDMAYRSAVDKANLARNSMYDATRKGGLFSADTLGKSLTAFSGGAGMSL